MFPVTVSDKYTYIYNEWIGNPIKPLKDGIKLIASYALQGTMYKLQYNSFPNSDSYLRCSFI